MNWNEKGKLQNAWKCRSPGKLAYNTELFVIISIAYQKAAKYKYLHEYIIHSLWKEIKVKNGTNPASSVLIDSKKTTKKRPGLEKSGDSWKWPLCLKSHWYIAVFVFDIYLLPQTHLHKSFSLKKKTPHSKLIVSSKLEFSMCPPFDRHSNKLVKAVGQSKSLLHLYYLFR